jgi:hypothetical protein
MKSTIFWNFTACNLMFTDVSEYTASIFRVEGYAEKARMKYGRSRRCGKDAAQNRSPIPRSYNP